MSAAAEPSLPDREAGVTDEDDDYTPMRWWNVIRQVRAHWAALGHIWVHNGPLWWLCSTCRSWRREDQL